MAFERVELTVGKAKAPAGLTITHLGKAVVALRKDLVAKAGFKHDMKFSVLLGVDDDRGKLRILKDKDGTPCARELEKTGAFFFNLGVLPAIGVTPSKQRPAEARCIENGIEIDLPPDDGPKLLAPPARMRAEKPPEAMGGGVTRTPKADGGETFNGVSIDLTEDEESVSFKGKSTEVTTRQAKFVRLLARPRPALVGEAFLIGALWDGKPPRDAAEQLRQMSADLQKGLSPIGLNLAVVKGVGYQLKDL
jgi:hypothetical protein